MSVDIVSKASLISDITSVTLISYALPDAFISYIFCGHILHLLERPG
jgi:hypothetical protein